MLHLVVQVLSLILIATVLSGYCQIIEGVDYCECREPLKSYEELEKCVDKYFKGTLIIDERTTGTPSPWLSIGKIRGCVQIRNTFAWNFAFVDDAVIEALDGHSCINEFIGNTRAYVPRSFWNLNESQPTLVDISDNLEELNENVRYGRIVMGDAEATQAIDEYMHATMILGPLIFYGQRVKRLEAGWIVAPILHGCLWIVDTESHELNFTGIEHIETDAESGAPAILIAGNRNLSNTHLAKANTLSVTTHRNGSQLVYYGNFINLPSPNWDELSTKLRHYFIGEGIQAAEEPQEEKTTHAPDDDDVTPNHYVHFQNRRQTYEDVDAVLSLVAIAVLALAALVQLGFLIYLFVVAHRSRAQSAEHKTSRTPSKAPTTRSVHRDTKSHSGSTRPRTPVTPSTEDSRTRSSLKSCDSTLGSPKRTPRSKNRSDVNAAAKPSHSAAKPSHSRNAKHQNATTKSKTRQALHPPQQGSKAAKHGSRHSKPPRPIETPKTMSVTCSATRTPTSVSGSVLNTPTGVSKPIKFPKVPPPSVVHPKNKSAKQKKVASSLPSKADSLKLFAKHGGGSAVDLSPVDFDKTPAKSDVGKSDSGTYSANGRHSFMHIKGKDAAEEEHWLIKKIRSPIVSSAKTQKSAKPRGGATHQLPQHDSTKKASKIGPRKQQNLKKDKRSMSLGGSIEEATTQPSYLSARNAKDAKNAAAFQTITSIPPSEESAHD